MFERFTDRARKVMALSNQEAQRFNHEVIGPEHVLLGIVKEGDCLATKILEVNEIDPRKVRLEVEKLIKSGPETITLGRLPQTPRTKRAIELAFEEAKSLQHNYIGTEHLLFGVIREGESIAAEVLKALGLTLEKAKAALPEMISEDTAPQATEAGQTFAQWYVAQTVGTTINSISTDVALRDWFAGQFLSNPHCCEGGGAAEAAKSCYAFADAMLAARQSRQGEAP